MRFSVPLVVGLTLLTLTSALTLTSGCATLNEIKALRQVDFTLDRIESVRIAGVDLERVRSEADLSAGDAGRLLLAIANRDVPLQMTVQLGAENPAENRTTARLVDLDWTLFVEDRETVSGKLTGNFVLPPGERVDVPVGVRLNLYDLANGGLAELLDLALAISGTSTDPKEVRLEAMPTVQTGFGPIRYPGRITIRRQVGSR